MSKESAVQLLQSYEGKVVPGYGLVGPDGFVDRIIRVVESKGSEGMHDQYYSTIEKFSGRIAAAAGQSAALEMHTQATKLGGNGPIMAYAMARQGFNLSYVGALGSEDSIHPVYQPLADIADTYITSTTAHTDALEFNDGKLMFQSMQELLEMGYEEIVEKIGKDKLIELFDKATFVSLNNWSALPKMTDIWKKIQAEILPHTASGVERHFFFDLADPQKRSKEDILEAIEVIKKFQPHYKVIMGFNEKEGAFIADVLGYSNPPEELEERILSQARHIRTTMDVEIVALHPISCACAVSREAEAIVEGPYVEKPLISTGAGDHFNAGFTMGLIRGGNLSESLACGVYTSGFYVRTAISPELGELLTFMASY
ncbi:MAG: carbohydrate kinase family protein [Lentisphaeria bacterium]|nr:carbohydrate kinase family protein [Lentisphaeria bacterium]